MKSRSWNPYRPEPAPPAFGAGKVLPEGQATFFSQLIFYWLGPFLAVGFSRPLEENDLWALPTKRLTSAVTSDLEENFYERCEPAKRPHFLQEQCAEESSSDDIKNDAQRDTRKWYRRKRAAEPISPVYDASLFKALHKTFFVRIWISGILNLCSEVLKTTTPLLNKVILTWLTESYIFYRLTDEQKASGILREPRGIGYGIGLAVALFVMQETASLMTNHYMQTGMVTGLYIRTALIGNIFRKSLRLSGRARLEHSPGQITTMISSDATRLDQMSVFVHSIWVAPVQIVIGFGLLLGNLGYSALVGLGVIIFGFPVQMVLILIMFKQHKKRMKITDTRVRLTTEVLQGIRLLKSYAWESFYSGRIAQYRSEEIAAIRKGSLAASGLIASMTFVPILASILSFITYALSGHDLNIAIIFSSLQLFNIIRAPLIMFPIILSSLTDALIAMTRISTFLSAEELAEPYIVDYSHGSAVSVDGDFTWETTARLAEAKTVGNEKEDGPNGNNEKGKQVKAEDKKKEKAKKKSHKKDAALPTTAEKDSATLDGDNEKGPVNEDNKDDDKPFELKNLKFDVPKGSFVAIVGRIGCGKSSILQSMIGEMRRTKGEIIFGGTVAYVPQNPWIRNSTLRENVVFGQDDNEERFREVVRACHLDHDLEMLPHGERTEIGEKGINLSGGQKARVSLARAAYSQSDIVLLDDPLSAVDAYVGKAILDQCLLNGPLADRTRILVTHALHVLDKVDYIYVLDNGVITEEGSYSSLMKDSVVFSKLMEEYGSLESEKGRRGLGEKRTKDHLAAEDPDEIERKKVEAALMQAEERNTGAITWEVYKKYLRSAGGLTWGPVILLLLILEQSASVANNLFLGFWTGNSIKGFTQGQYMAVYGGLGAAQAVFSFVLNYAFVLLSLIASLRLFKAALSGVIRSPVSFFDTTPMGRILSRLSKDQDTLDSEIAMTMWMFLSTFASVLGTVGLVFYTFPYLGIIFAPMAVLYYIASIYYRRSSVETKRLDSMLRSSLYSSFSETLTGLSTIRAYREQKSSIASAERGLDRENRAYYMTISIQRWLSIRLDFFGNVLIFGIALFAAGFRHTVSPAKIGVVLSYTLGITQIFAEMIAQFAKNEQNMNAVERILHYTELLPEGATSTPDDPPPAWPEKGHISFSGVDLAYREGLPLVLKGVTFEVRPGEKIGIVGRTGAGKSSLLQALFRTVELRAGKVEIDGYDISKIGLDTLRGRLALVPQDSTLFLGTLRDNLDPQRLRTDAELISVLQRAWLLPREGASDPAAEAKFSLDSTVGDEGSNFSAGEKQLLALCRALVKSSRIIILDEATSSVDVETDTKLQRTIQTEFAASTLLCIAHRLNTIAHYDRILVMDGGEIAEFDTVLGLYDSEGSVFRSLCNEANLQRADILRIRADHGSALV